MFIIEQHISIKNTIYVLEGANTYMSMPCHNHQRTTRATLKHIISIIYMTSGVDDSFQQRLIKTLKSSSRYWSTWDQVLIITTNETRFSRNDKFYSSHLAKHDLLFNENFRNICFGSCHLITRHPYRISFYDSVCSNRAYPTVTWIIDVSIGYMMVIPCYYKSYYINSLVFMMVWLQVIE